MGAFLTTPYGNPLQTGALGAAANPLAVPPPPWIGHNSGALSTTPTSTHQWFYLTRRFTQFLGNITITVPQREAGEKSQAGVRSCLNRHYWGYASETANSLLIGSWGKFTRGRPSRDIDVLFLLPPAVYHRFQSRTGSKQSALLQEVKEVLTTTYSRTTMRGDGQVVSVPFDQIPIEVAPGFRCDDGSIIVCNTNNGGEYKISTAEAEERELAASDLTWNGNTRALVRMLKVWQRERNVPLKSFHLERLAIEFLAVWPYSKQNVFWYDWMLRDFLAYLIGRANGHFAMPGTSEIISLGSEWLSRAQTAYQQALSACINERDNYQALAGTDWQKVFGTAIPVLV
jgi:hypothetical protein